MNHFFTPTPPDPLDVARDHDVDQMIEEADMKDRQLRAYVENIISAIGDKRTVEGLKLEDQVLEGKRLVAAALDTGSIRTDKTRQLYIDMCKFVGREPT